MNGFRKLRELLLVGLVMVCLQGQANLARGSSKAIKKPNNVRSMSHGEKRKLVRQVHEALRDPQDKELEQIEKNSSKTLGSLPYSPSKARRISSESMHDVKGKWILNWLAVGGGVVSDSEGGLWGATTVGWTPTLILNDDVRIKVQLGVSGLNIFTAGTFVSGDAFAGIVYSGTSPFLVDFGGGVQYWSNKQGFLPQVRTAFGYRFEGKGGLIHAFQVSYSRLFDHLIDVNMVVASLALRF